jgi:hypothetical protein
LTHDVDWDTNYHTLYLHGDTIRLTNDDAYAVVIQHLLLNDTQDSLLLSGSKNGIHLDTLLQALNLQEIDLNIFKNDSNFLTLHGIVNMIAENPAIKQQIIDAFLQEADTSIYLRHAIKTWLFNNTEQLGNVFYGIARDYLANHPEILDSLAQNQDVLDKIVVGVFDSLIAHLPEITDFIGQQLVGYATTHLPDVLNYIQSLGLIDSLLANMPQITDVIGQQMLDYVATHMPRIVHYIQVSGLDTVIVNYMKNHILPAVFDSADLATVLPILSHLPDTLEYFKNLLIDTLQKQVAVYQNVVMQQITDTVKTLLEPLIRTVIGATAKSSATTISFGVSSSVEIKAYGVCYLSTADPVAAIVPCPVMKENASNVTAGSISMLPLGLPYPVPLVLTVNMNTLSSGTYNVRPFVVTLEGGIVYGPYMENIAF